MAHILPDPSGATFNDRERDNLLTALKALRSERFSIDHREYALTQGARALGATWEQIGDALDRYAQEAEKRYKELEERIGP